MSWTLLAPKYGSETPHQFHLTNDSTAFLVNLGGSVGVVHEPKPGVHPELGRITISPSGAKLEAIDHVLSILPGHAKIDPHIAQYELSPHLGERLEIIILRHGDVVSSSQAKGRITCIWNQSEIQVNSSAAEAETKMANALDSGADTPEEETEDEDLDNTITAVQATQSKSQQHQATPQLSNSRSVVQETPTVARVNSFADISVPPRMEIDQLEPMGNTPSPEHAFKVEAAPYSTARTGQSQNGSDEHSTNIAKASAEEAEPHGADDHDVSPPIDLSEDAIKDRSDDTLPKTRHPKVMISKKRPSSETETPDRSSKRSRRISPSGNEIQDSRLRNLVVNTSPATVPATKVKKRKSAVKDLEDAHEATPSRSQRSSQRSNSVAATTTEPYQGDTPCVATSNSSITEKSQAVKFLKKQGGSLVDSVMAPYNVLCVRDGSLPKTPKVLQAIAAGTPIVTDKWLTDSAKAGHILDVAPYIPVAPKQEKEWNFKLDDVIARPQTPFAGFTVHFTSSLHAAYKNFTEIEQVCKAAGAEKVTKKKKKIAESDKVIILAVEEGDEEAEKLMQEGLTCYNRDLLPLSIFRGVLDLDSDEFKISGGASVVATTAKETKKKRGKSS